MLTVAVSGSCCLCYLSCFKLCPLRLLSLSMSFIRFALSFGFI
jgi:hypothetical protein